MPKFLDVEQDDIESKADEVAYCSRVACPITTKQKIIKECFWDLSLTPNDIDDIVSGDDFRRKAFLFEKILLNSTTMLHDLKVFNAEDLRVLLEGYKLPSFNKNHAFKRSNIAKVYFLDKPLLVDELRWIH